jgi:hypothetical protein
VSSLVISGNEERAGLMIATPRRWCALLLWLSWGACAEPEPSPSASDAAPALDLTTPAYEVPSYESGEDTEFPATAQDQAIPAADQGDEPPAADGGAAEDPDDNGDLPDAVVELMSPHYDRVSRWIENTARGLDRFFGSDEAWLIDNETYLRVSETMVYDQRGHYNDSLRQKLRLDLPTAKERLRVVIESAPDDPETPTDRAPGNTRISQDNTVFGLSSSRQRDPRKGWSLRNQIGARFRMPLDPYVRSIAKRTWALESGWELNSYNRVAWLDSEGYSATSRIDVAKPLDEVRQLRWITDFRWREEEDTLELRESLNLTYILNRRSAINYAVGFNGHSWSHMLVDTAFVFADYRRNIYRELIYVNVTPSISFPREQDFRSNWAISVEVEFYFRDEL